MEQPSVWSPGLPHRWPNHQRKTTEIAPVLPWPYHVSQTRLLLCSRPSNGFPSLSESKTKFTYPPLTPSTTATLSILLLLPGEPSSWLFPWLEHSSSRSLHGQLSRLLYTFTQKPPSQWDFPRPQLFWLLTSILNSCTPSLLCFSRNHLSLLQFSHLLSIWHPSWHMSFPCVISLLVFKEASGWSLTYSFSHAFLFCV